ncbi:hypothetical protein [Vibrio aestuarianus]|uniref:Uncharacterized protein n=2 Tax=Vibrio aestuarianus TaxID=28171 RepID=A0ABN8TMS4_9VIBR|nr:hypothetical protein [Vibrio aestuarianus]MDE1255373.1 hypothetical protein [Vibrio aestuarianus]MDE1273274.1 hypothetical protein [Vibrio aestuarianus]MDH5893426.1 hypothetical protein [Vibrio aestuarianus]MDH5901664.1 hypothetical protein [Vibrio aestuarianus]MDH5956737.1 hypothetical protein [Vibrio aestuarianus]
MSHDFSIKRIKNDKYACFFGYARGVCYTAFNAQEFNGVVSGAFGGKEVTKVEAENGISMIIDKIKKGYPDPTRADELKDFLIENIQGASDEELFYIHYS